MSIIDGLVQECGNSIANARPNYSCISIISTMQTNADMKFWDVRCMIYPITDDNAQLQ